MQLWCWKLARWSSTRTFGTGAWDEPCRLLGGAAKQLSTYHVSSAENHVFCMSWMLWNTHEYTRIWMNIMETEWNMMNNARLWWKHFGFPCVCNSHEAHGKWTSVENQSCLTMYLNNKTTRSSISPGLLRHRSTASSGSHSHRETIPSIFKPPKSFVALMEPLPDPVDSEWAPTAPIW